MHVLIVGAGVGGLSLAQSLRKQGISFEIFERDNDSEARFQGWAIAMHSYVRPCSPVNLCYFLGSSDNAPSESLTI